MLDSIDRAARKLCIGGSDAKIIMGTDQKALIQLWKEKRGEAEPEDYSRNLVVQLGNATEDLNAQWFEQEHPSHTLAMRQTSMVSNKYRFMGCTLDGIVAPDGDVFEGKFMLPWNFDADAALAKHYWQVQHNMLVAEAKRAFLSIITGGGQYLCIEVAASSVDLAHLIGCEQMFWRCVEDGTEPLVIGAAPPVAPAKAVKIVNMAKSNAWAMHAATYLETKEDHGRHEEAKKLLKELVPNDAKEARGHGICAARSKNGALSFKEFTEEEVVDA